jgi:hypothetical protein
MSKYTAERWEWDSDGHIYQEPADTAASGAEADPHICRVNMGRDGAERYRALIAAAPDLLEACKQLLEAQVCRDCALCDLARAAIAKAEGGES